MQHKIIRFLTNIIRMKTGLLHFLFESGNGRAEEVKRREMKKGNYFLAMT